MSHEVLGIPFLVGKANAHHTRASLIIGGNNDDRIFYLADVNPDGSLLVRHLVWDSGTSSWVPADKVQEVTGTFETEAAVYTLRMDEASDTVTYIGEAEPGTAEDASAWRIKKIDTTSGLKILFAGGENSFDSRWDQRTGLSYS